MRHPNIYSINSVLDSHKNSSGPAGKAIAFGFLTDYIRKRENLNHRTHFVSPIHYGGRVHECSHI
jgi:hypothetical protein